MTTEKTSGTSVLIIGLLIGNLGLSAYIAFRPLPPPRPVQSQDAATADITAEQAKKLSDTLVPLYNQKNITELYDRFDPLARVQITKEQVATQIGKLLTILGRIEDCAYSHATVAGVQDGRTYYALHYKVRLSGGQLPNGSLTITVARNAGQLGLFGFYVGGNSNEVSP